MATPWNEIKAEYLQAVTPKELANKYGLTAKQISDKANKEKWVSEKSEISENVREGVQERIKGLTNLALDTLMDVINDPETENHVRVQASKAILDISGLKSLKQEVTGITPTSVIINHRAVAIESNN